MPDTEVGGARPQPIYGAKRVDTIPKRVPRPRVGPRMDPELFQALLDCAAEPGQAFQIGEYQSENGADNTAKRFENMDKDGNPKVPDYEFPVRGLWSLEPRKIDAPEEFQTGGRKRKQWSVLYATFDGPEPNGDAADEDV